MSQTAAGATTLINRDRYELTAADRCDSCGAQAYIRVTIGDSQLLFCAHHGRRHQEKLSVIATEWHDESDRLLATD
jgi:hypothetical protein